MYRGVVSGDGMLARGEDDHLAVVLPIGDRISENAAARLLNPETSGNLVPELLGRSSLGQMGIDIKAVGKAESHSPHRAKSKTLIVNFTAEAHTAVGEQLIEDMHAITSDAPRFVPVTYENQELGIGRFVNVGALERLEKEDVEEAIAGDFVAFGANGNTEYEVNDDGSVTMPISHLEFMFNQHRFKTPEQRLKILKLGRSAIVPHSDVIEREADDPLPEFLVGGVLFSPGPYYLSIQPNAGDNYRQLKSARFIDSNRLMGMNPSRPHYDRNRQVELVSTKRNSGQTYGDTTVKVDLFRDTDLRDTYRGINWFNLSKLERSNLHRDGVSPLNIVRAADPTVRSALTKIIDDSKNAALILSRKGAIIVPAGETYKFDVQNILDATEDWGEKEADPAAADLSSIVENLAAAGDRSTVVVARTLKPEDMLRIANEGDVKAFLVDEINPDGPFLSKEQHSMLAEMARDGVAVGWDGEFYRELHKSGLFMKPESLSQIEDLELVVAMYGGNRDIIGQNLQPQISNFFDRLMRIVPKEKLGVAHGSGQGVMDTANTEALKRGMLSMGVGISVEQVGQETKSTADGLALFQIRDRLYRQQMLDTFNTISIFNIGGSGTLEEMFISVCTHKLTMCLPTPKIAVDEDGLYKNAEEMIAEISNRESIKINGHEVDLTEDPFVDRWVTNTFHRVSNYEEAGDIIEEFITDPAKYWKDCGISPAKIKIALNTHMERLQQVGMKLPGYLKEAAEAYIAQ